MVTESGLGHNKFGMLHGIACIRIAFSNESTIIVRA